MPFVLDNSVTMRWLFGDGSIDDRAYASGILERLERPDIYALAPSIWPLEVANVIARAEVKGWLTEARSSEFTGLLKQMAIHIDPATADHALADTLQLARRFGLSSYDAAYLELALREGHPLATLDQDMRAAATKAGALILTPES